MSTSPPASASAFVMNGVADSAPYAAAAASVLRMRNASRVTPVISMAASSGATMCDACMFRSRFGWWWLGQERLDGLQDGVHVHPLGERAVGQRPLQAALAAEAATEQLVQGGRVTRLDGVDRQRR